MERRFNDRSIHSKYKPRKIIDNINLEEDFTRRKPNVEHFRIFGSPIYTHIPKDKRKNLDLVGMKGIFVGYNNSSKTYRIYIK